MARRAARRRGRIRPGSVGVGSGSRESSAGPVLPIAFALALLVLAAFSPVLAQRQFAVVDDAAYVSESPPVAAGLHADGVAWAFGLHGHMGNWHPVTWLSHMADVSLFGPEPRAHKAVNVALHAAATVLCFLALHAMTGQPWPSAFAAALFGVHPLRVESVVWVSERKDVLAAFFWMAALLAWARHVAAPRGRARWLALGCFALGLASKSMVVTLPLVLLLLDRWPLGRHRAQSFGSLVREKLPMLALAAATGVVALAMQSRAAAVATLERFGASQRVANAFRSLFDYATSFLFPSQLGPYYPHRFPTASSIDEPAEWLPAMLSFAVFAGVCAAAFAMRRRAPAVAVGWAWFVVSIAPVLGLVQIGHQGMADRYTYLPSVGLALAVAFPLWVLARTSAAGRSAYAIGASALAIGCLAPWTAATTRYWTTNVELSRHALAVIDARGLPHDGFMQRMLAASHLQDARRPGAAPLDPVRAAEALQAAETALELRPADPEAHSTYTDVLIETGRFADAVAATDGYLAAARTRGRTDFVALAYYSRGIGYARMHDYERARVAFERAVESAPDFGLAVESLAWARDAAAAAPPAAIAR